MCQDFMARLVFFEKNKKKAKERQKEQTQSVVPSGRLRRDYCPGLPLRPKTQVLQLAKALGIILRPKDDTDPSVVRLLYCGVAVFAHRGVLQAPRQRIGLF
uniref:60S ribosomal protein L13a n=1 Tax=Bursaphelenchus xylophilus TaxID=6326 RepID=A0A1I7RN20_BURXY